MHPGVETERSTLGLSEKDLEKIRQEGRRRRLVTIISGGVGTIAAMVAGYATAHSLYYDPGDDLGMYPYAAPLAVAGLAGDRSRRSIIGIAASMTAAFVLMFTITALGYTREPPPAIMYSVWHRT